MSLFGVIRDAVTGLTAAVTARSQTPTGNAMQVQIGPGDVISSLPVVIDFDHHQIHEGEAFRYGFYANSVGVNANFDVELTVANISGITDAASNVRKAPHLRFEIVTSGAANMFVYESPTYSAPAPTWNARTPVALERYGTYTPHISLADSTDATLNTGTQIWRGMTTASKNQGGGVADSANEFVLKNNTKYLIRVTSASAANSVLVRVVWYEDAGV